MNLDEQNSESATVAGIQPSAQGQQKLSWQTAQQTS
jgi:hypothetical protein